MTELVWNKDNKIADPGSNAVTNAAGLLGLTPSGLDGSFAVFTKDPDKDAKHLGLPPEVQRRIWHHNNDGFLSRMFSRVQSAMK